jgi:hypothetical protein
MPFLPDGRLILIRPLLLVTLLARVAAAQAPDTTHRVPGATISGVVHDSIARRPLAGAIVQLVAGDTRFSRTAESDSLGRFTLSDVPDGRYMLGFLHPMLDSLGVEAPLREVSVAGHRPVRAELGVPSPARLRAAICGTNSADSSALVVGSVRDASDGSPAAGVSVTGEWLEFSLRRDGLVRHVQRLVATTGDNGWFAMCNVPTAGTMVLIASRGADSTDLIEVQIPPEGFMRRELYLGHARTVVTSSTRRTDTLAPPPRRVRMGDGTLSGTVVAAERGQPVSGAHVSLTDGPETRSNERGEWTLSDAPVGTRMLEIRALGFYPDRRQVNIVKSAPPVRVALSTFKAVLDTVKVRATRLADRHLSGFQQRRRTGMGRFLTPEDITIRRPIVTSDLFRMLPGLSVERSPLGETMVVMRGTFSERCSPEFYIDDRDLRDISADDVDDWVNPDDIAGIEVYTGAFTPSQYQSGLHGNGCGSIVIWTK